MPNFSSWNEETVTQVIFSIGGVLVSLNIGSQGGIKKTRYKGITVFIGISMTVAIGGEGRVVAREKTLY